MSNMKTIQEYLINMKTIQKVFIEYFDTDNDSDENFQNIINLILDQKILTDANELKLFLYFFVNLSNNHHRKSNFYEKIDKTLHYFSNEIKSNFSNNEIFYLFKSNKRILLYLIKNKIFDLDEDFSYLLSNENNSEFFYPEIKNYLDESQIKNLNENELLTNFEEKREIGENENYLSNLIRTDSIKEFIIYINKNLINLNTVIHHSIFETNQFLIDKNVTLIEYAAFFGSIQIFRYLYQNGVDLTPSLWTYAIHGSNPDLIHFLEECKVGLEDSTYKKYLCEAIKCNHNDIFIYIKDNFLKDFDIELIKQQSLIYFNFDLIEDDYISKSLFCDLCLYNYDLFVLILMKLPNIDRYYKRVFL